MDERPASAHSLLLYSMRQSIFGARQGPIQSGTRCAGPRTKDSMIKEMFTIIIVATLTSLALGACEMKHDKDQAEPQTRPAPASAPSHAPAHAQSGVQPGSHEDWCGEHQVPESLCTRCNSSLIAAFKATNDWCEEHTLPESQCLICNPQLKIERPLRTGDANR